MSVKTLSDLGERAFLEWLRPRLPGRPDVAIGAGDDCAIVRFTPTEDLVLKSDPVLENRHFTATDDPLLVGRKALGRVLSDFAAMGATPCWALVDFTAPASLPVKTAERLFRGLASMAEEFDVALVGGDTTRGDSLALHVFCAGAVPRGEALLRAAARPGDALYVTGALGCSFESGHHLSFRPRVAEGRFLRTVGVHACIDVSDGLASELRHIAAESHRSLRVDDAALPLSPLCAASPDPLAHAYGDGEDFELLFSADPSFDPDAFRARFPKTSLARIGEVLEGDVPTVLRVGADGRTFPLEADGFDHFAS